MAAPTCTWTDDDGNTCPKKAHARGLCSTHYGRFRRDNPDATIATRVGPGATLADRIAAHATPTGGHLIWDGFMHRGLPIFATNTPDGRQVHNVRRVQLELDGRPEPALDNVWFPVTTCGEDACVEPSHLTWTNRKPGALLSTEIVDDLIARHFAGDLNVADEADRLGVSRWVIYRAMQRRGYKAARRPKATAG